MNWKQVSAAAALSLALASVAAPASAQLAEGVAAVVNDHVISTFDVRQRANLLLASSGIQPTPELQTRARAQALRDLIDERLQMEGAAEYHITVSSTEVDQRVGDIARQNHTTVDELANQLAQQGVSVASLRAQLEADMAWERLIGGLYGSRLRISDLEVRETQARIVANAARPQYQISEIFLPADTEHEFTEMQDGAMRLLQEMQRGAPFPMVARQFSRSASAAAGGDIGWIASTDLAPELQPIAERLQAGQVSVPIRTPTGIYIIAMRDRRAGVPAGAASVVTLRQITAPAARSSVMERLQRRVEACGGLDDAVAAIPGAAMVDLGQSTEADLSPTIRSRIANVAAGHASPVQVSEDQASMIVVCARQVGGADIPDRTEIEARLRDQELAMLGERYLRNLRREATIITRQ